MDSRTPLVRRCRFGKFSPSQLRQIFTILGRYLTPRDYLKFASTSSNSTHFRCMKSVWGPRVRDILQYFPRTHEIHGLWDDGLYYKAYTVFFKFWQLKVRSLPGSLAGNSCLPSELRDRMDVVCDNVLAQAIRVRVPDYTAGPRVPGVPGRRPRQGLPVDETSLLTMDPRVPNDGADNGVPATDALGCYTYQTMLVYREREGRTKVRWQFRPAHGRVDVYLGDRVAFYYSIGLATFVENPGLVFSSTWTYDSSCREPLGAAADGPFHLVERDGSVVSRTRTRNPDRLETGTDYVNWARLEEFSQIFSFFRHPVHGTWVDGVLGPEARACPDALVPGIRELPFSTDSVHELKGSPAGIINRCGFGLENTEPGRAVDRVTRILVLHVVNTNPHLRRVLRAQRENRVPLPQVRVGLATAGTRSRRVFQLGPENMAGETRVDFTPFLRAAISLGSRAPERKRVKHA